MGALLDAGVARVVVGTAAFGPTPLREFVSDRVAVAIDVAGGIVRTNGWLESTELTTAQALERCADAGVATVICTAIDRDGTRSGPDLELLREVRARFAGRVLAAGGIRDAADVAAVRDLGLDGVVVGRAWLDGALACSRLSSDRRGLAHLRQPELVAGRIAERGVDAVRALLGRLGELEPARGELLVGGLRIVGREQDVPGPPLRHHAPDLVCRRASSTGGPGIAFSSSETSV